MNVASERPAAHGRYYPYIDGLRALAVLSVLVYHLHSPWLPGGFVGVDVFFVISGFIVSASVAGFKGAGFGQFLGYFYARRLKRIGPALVVCLLVTACLSALFIPASWLSVENQKTGIYAFFGLSNLVLAKSGRDYFAPTAEFNPYTHTWSLAVEEQFYLVFPLLFFLWLNGSRRSLAMGAVAGTLLASLVWGAWQSHADPIAAYYLTPSRFWELAAGVLLYQLISQRRQSSPATQRAMLLRGLVGGSSLIAILAAFVVTPSARFPVPGVLPAVLGALGIIWCLHDRPQLRRLHGLLGSRPLVFVGKISYSLYLWHWPVFVLFRWTFGLQSPTTRGLAVGLAFVLAIASWRFVENPARYSQRLRRLPEAAIIAGSLSIVALAWGVAIGIGANEHRFSISTVSRNPEVWYPNVVAADPEAPGCTAEPERRNVAGGRLYVYAPSGCANPRPLAETSIYVIGDSHAAAYEGLFRRYAIRHATRISVYANGGCSFISLQPWRDLNDAQCRHHTEAALDDLRKTLKPGDVLFLPSLRLQRFSTQWAYLGEEPAKAEMFGPRAERGRRRSVNYAVETLRALTERGALVIIEAPKPLFKAPPFRCADWFNRHNPVCDPGFVLPRALLDTFRQPVLESLADIARQVPGVSIWDPYPVLCPEEQCRAWRDGKPLFLDGDHLSGNGNLILLPSFTAAVETRLRR